MRKPSQWWWRRSVSASLLTALVGFSGAAFWCCLVIERSLNNYPDPQDVVLGWGRPRALGLGLSGFRGILIQDLGYEFPRISLLGSPVNKGMKRGPGCYSPALFT